MGARFKIHCPVFFSSILVTYMYVFLYQRAATPLAVAGSPGVPPVTGSSVVVKVDKPKNQIPVDKSAGTSGQVVVRSAAQPAVPPANGSTRIPTTINNLTANSTQGISMSGAAQAPGTVGKLAKPAGSSASLSDTGNPTANSSTEISTSSVENQPSDSSSDTNQVMLLIHSFL